MTATPPLAIPARLRFAGLSSTAFEHPGDRAALEALRRTPGLDKLIKSLSDIGIERYVRLQYAGDAIRVSPRQCSRLYNDLREACAILDVREPEFYLSQNPQPGAIAFGMQRHTIVMTTAMVEILNDEERLQAIGRELGHIKAEHMLYRTMARVLAESLTSLTGIFAGPTKLLTQGLLYAFYAWFRESELTADRAGVLTVQDPNIGISSLLKLIGGTQKMMDDLNIDEFTKQADLFEDLDEDLLSMYYKFRLIATQPFPFPASRAREMRDWGQSEEFRRLLRGDYPRTDTEAGRRVCANCGNTVTNITFQFCPECGLPLNPIASA